MLANSGPVPSTCSSCTHVPPVTVNVSPSRARICAGAGYTVGVAGITGVSSAAGISSLASVTISVVSVSPQVYTPGAFP